MYCYLCGQRCAGIEFQPDAGIPLRIFLCWACHRKCGTIYRCTKAAREAVIARWPGLTDRISSDGME